MQRPPVDGRGQASAPASAGAGRVRRLRSVLMAGRRTTGALPPLVATVLVVGMVAIGILSCGWGSRGPWRDPSNPFSFFDEVVVITVPSRQARVVALLAMLGLGDRAVVMAAVPKPRTDRDWAELRASTAFVPSTLDLLTAGETAVSQSQRKALRTFLANANADCGLIFEDDFHPNGESLQQVRARLEMAMPFLRPPPHLKPGDGPQSPRWDILFLGRCHDHCEYDKHIGADVYQVFNPACLHAYAVTRAAARLIIKAAAVCEGAMCPIDNVVRSLIRGTSMLPNARRLTAFAISPQLFTQESKYRGDLSMVKADQDDIARMKAEGKHLSHAQRGGRDELVECMLHHERVLVSNFDLWRDRASRKPSPLEREWQQNMLAAEAAENKQKTT